MTAERYSTVVQTHLQYLCLVCDIVRLETFEITRLHQSDVHAQGRTAEAGGKAVDCRLSAELGARSSLPTLSPKLTSSFRDLYELSRLPILPSHLLLHLA